MRISAEAALLLARAPPIELLARERAAVFKRLRAAEAPLLDVGELYAEESRETRTLWRTRIRGANLAGRVTRELIAPVFDMWIERRHGALTFHLTQILTGHGCFNAFLFRINRSTTDRCAHCTEAAVDTNKHTVEDCKAWDAERERLCQLLEVPNITLEVVIQHMTQGLVGWKVVQCFAERVLRIKEEAERERQEQLPRARIIPR